MKHHRIWKIFARWSRLSLFVCGLIVLSLALRWIQIERGKSIAKDLLEAHFAEQALPRAADQIQAQVLNFLRGDYHLVWAPRDQIPLSYTVNVNTGQIMPWSPTRASEPLMAK